MGKQRSKRARSQAREFWTPGYRGPGILRNDSPTYLYRKVDYESAEALNKATRRAKDPRATRVLDHFTLTLVYPNNIEKARQRSSLAKPPTASEIAKKLGELPLGSLAEPVTANVLGVNPYAGTLGVYVDYPEYEQEQRSLKTIVNDMLEIRKSQRVSVGPGEPHISIIKGQLVQVQVNQIKGSLPSQIQLLGVQSCTNPTI